MRRDVRAIFIDGEDRAARGKAAAVRNGEVVHGDDRDDAGRDQARSAAFASSQSWSISSSVS